jgi:hypothetical protein
LVHLVEETIPQLTARPEIRSEGKKLLRLLSGFTDIAIRYAGFSLKGLTGKKLLGLAP